MPDLFKFNLFEVLWISEGWAGFAFFEFQMDEFDRSFFGVARSNHHWFVDLFWLRISLRGD